MPYVSTHPLFRDLDTSEEESFREYAEKNPPDRPESWAIFHPVCRRAWLARGITPPANADMMGQTNEGPGMFVPEWQFRIAMVIRNGPEKDTPDDDEPVKLSEFSKSEENERLYRLTDEYKEGFDAR
jgi:hypothetical protein